MIFYYNKQGLFINFCLKKILKPVVGLIIRCIIKLTTQLKSFAF